MLTVKPLDREKVMKNAHSTRSLVVISLLIGLVSGASAWPVEEGNAAAKEGDFEAAFIAFRKAAEQGYALAQIHQGCMHAIVGV